LKTALGEMRDASMNVECRFLGLVYVIAFASRLCKHGFPKSISLQSVVAVATVQVRLHLQEAAVEEQRLVTERDGHCLVLAGTEDIL
jgi:hypothetical protein